MENKKLLKYLLKDLGELEELLNEKGTDGFDELEIEFMQSRLSGAMRLIRMLDDKEKDVVEKTETKAAEPVAEEHPAGPAAEEAVAEEKNEEKQAPEVVAVEKPLAPTNGNAGVVAEEKTEVGEPRPEPVPEPEPVAQKEEVAEEAEEPAEPDPVMEEQQSEKAVELEEEPVKEGANQRLGDRFTKEKSVNELLVSEGKNLEHKISNMPVTSIKSAIGINDRFQYIRELFEGSADTFAKTVDDLDAMNDIKEAVAYLQQNFKWKKNETSLKFVNLVKRRFPNE